MPELIDLVGIDAPVEQQPGGPSVLQPEEEAVWLSLTHLWIESLLEKPFHDLRAGELYARRSGCSRPGRYSLAWTLAPFFLSSSAIGTELTRHSGV